MTDVCFVLMPYASLEHPSIAIGLLKACLNRAGINSNVIYANIWFAEEIGLNYYHTVNATRAEDLVGEWTFAGSVFPEFHPNHTEYLQLIDLTYLNKIGNLVDKELHELLWEIRQKVPAFIDRVAQTILENKPRIVSCSSTFQQHCSSLALLKRLREIAPEVITLIGGANCEGIMGLTTHREFPWIDFVVSGEGDNLFANVCSLLIKHGRDIDPAKLPHGVISPSHRQDSSILTTAPRAAVHNIDTVPIPDYDDYFQALHESTIASYIKPGLLVETSRGCWWGQKSHCTFCGLNGKGITYRSKSTTRVVEEFAELACRYNIRNIEVVDNILSIAHLHEVLPIFSTLKERYEIFYETKANLKYQQVKQLAEAGVCWIQPGIESMHDEILKLMKKGNTAAINIQLLKWCRELGIRVSWSILCNFPGEDDEWYTEMVEWLPLIIHLQPPSSMTKVRYDRFSPYHQRPADFGITIAPFRTYAYVYPLPNTTIADLAYFFEDANEQGSQQLLHLNDFERLGLAAIQKFLQEWWDRFWSYSLPLLAMEDDGQRLKIIDTRPCATQRVRYLEGLNRQVYLTCDQGRSTNELLDVLHKDHNLTVSWDEVQLVLDWLQKSKILLFISGKFLSLAVNGRIPPLPRIDEFPGGYTWNVPVNPKPTICKGLIRT